MIQLFASIKRSDDKGRQLFGLIFPSPLTYRPAMCRLEQEIVLRNRRFEAANDANDPNDRNDTKGLKEVRGDQRWKKSK